MAVSIGVNTDKNVFIITGNIDSILNNRRLQLRFKRLKFEEAEIQLKSPFAKKLK